MVADHYRSDWTWENPDECTWRLDQIRAGGARCEKLEALDLEPPFSQRDLRDFGLNGIEFATFTTQHPSGLAADRLPMWSDDMETGPGRIFRVAEDSYFTQLDIAQPLPFASSCLDWVYAEHLIEHVPPHVGIAWLAEVRRLLAPGGLLRLTTPDLRKYVRAYLDGGSFFAEHRQRLRTVLAPAPAMPERPAFMVNQIFAFYGHRWVYDVDELRYALTQAGFDPAAIRVCPFARGQREDVAALDTEVRSDETFYIEATR